MKVALVGYELEGRAAYTYWSKLGADITICDRDSDKELPKNVSGQLGESYLENLDRFDIVWRTAGINPRIILENNPGLEDKITTTMNEFLRVSPTKNVIGITGTKGKGTTSTLTTKMLEAQGYQAYLGGNIGLSPFDFLPNLTPETWVVLELSSFQLNDLKRSPHLAVCLTITPEHLDWHRDMDDYVSSKAQLFKYQSSEDIAIYYAENDTSKAIAANSPGKKIPYFAQPGAIVNDGMITIGNQDICKTSELKLLGKHNWQNACAAVTVVWQVDQNVEAIRSALVSFSGLEHRLEFVRELDNVKYYDDSFGTNPATAIVALRAFQQPKVIILGGSDKGADFDELATYVKSENVRQVILIGKTAAKIEASLRKSGFSAITNGGETMPDIVAAAKTAAQPGDVILLSTACASFDMFPNYKERGNQFKAIVKAL